MVSPAPRDLTTVALGLAKFMEEMLLRPTTELVYMLVLGEHCSWNRDA